MIPLGSSSDVASAQVKVSGCLMPSKTRSECYGHLNTLAQTSEYTSLAANTPESLDLVEFPLSDSFFHWRSLLGAG